MEIGEIPFSVDPTQINYKLLGSISIPKGSSFFLTLSAIDTEGDPLYFFNTEADAILGVNVKPADMVYKPGPNATVNSAGELNIDTTGLETGVYYMNVFVTDQPTMVTTPGPLTDSGSIPILITERTNTKPNLFPFGNLPI
jgi:hypothetical protein